MALLKKEEVKTSKNLYNNYFNIVSKNDEKQ